MNSADQRVLQLLIWSLVPTRDVRVQIFPQPAKTCFYWFTLFWHQREKDYRSRVCSGRSDRGVWSELRERGKIKEEERERERVPSLSLHITSHHVTSRSHSKSLLTSPHPLIFFPAHVFLRRHHNLNAWNRPSDQKSASHSWIKKIIINKPPCLIRRFKARGKKVTRA